MQNKCVSKRHDDGEVRVVNEHFATNTKWRICTIENVCLQQLLRSVLNTAIVRLVVRLVVRIVVRLVVRLAVCLTESRKYNCAVCITYIHVGVTFCRFPI